MSAELHRTPSTPRELFLDVIFDIHALDEGVHHERYVVERLQRLPEKQVASLQERSAL